MPSFILFYPSLWPEHTNVIDKSDRTDSSAIAWGEQMLSDRCLFCLSLTLVYCGQMVGWIRMPLGMEEGLGPGPAFFTERETAAPTFEIYGRRLTFVRICTNRGQCLLWPNGHMDQDAT